MKLHFFLIISVCSAILYSQSKDSKVYAYDFIVNGGRTSSDLKIHRNEALYSIYFSIINENAESEISDDDMQASTIIRVPAPNAYVYTNFDKGLINSNERFLNKTFDVRDTLMDLNWEIKNEYKDYLGFKCQKAELSFRGREYVAYFNPEIPVTVGPYKFHGLPGLIFSIASKDNYLKILLTKIDYQNYDNLNVFKNKILIDYQEYKSLVQNKYKDIVNHTKSKYTGKQQKGFFMYDGVEHDLYQAVSDEVQKQMDTMYGNKEKEESTKPEDKD